MSKTENLKRTNFNFNASMTLHPAIRQDLFWWLLNINHVSQPIQEPNPQVVIYTDASLLGWGCDIPATGLKTGGR